MQLIGVALDTRPARLLEADAVDGEDALLLSIGHDMLLFGVPLPAALAALPPAIAGFAGFIVRAKAAAVKRPILGSPSLSTKSRSERGPGVPVIAACALSPSP